MNYFAHARLASAFACDPGFVLGTMLPDFAGMIGARILRIDDARLREGERHHHRQDHAFHRAPEFRELVLDATRWLRRHGVSRGPSRGVAHVGVELLFDGALLGDAHGDRAYLRALADAPRRGDHIRWSGEETPARWRTLHERLWEDGLPHALRDPQRVAARVFRVLERRPSLRVAPRERPVVECWLARARPEVTRRSAVLLEQTLAALASDR